MRRAMTASGGIVSLVFVIGTPQIAVAQNSPAGEIAGGYSFLQDFTNELSVPAGWFVSGAGNVTDVLAIVGEVSGAYKTVEALVLDVDLDLYTFMGGVRYYRRLARVTPFAQFFLGAARLSAESTFLGFTESESETEFAIQPGAGIDIRLTDRLAARLQGDWRRIFFAEGFSDDSNEFRFAVGLVVGLGSR